MEMKRHLYLTFSVWTFCLCVIIAISLFWDLGSLHQAFNQMIFFKVRVPRTFEALMVGAILTLTGQLFQTVLNNPLADSFTLGLASGATFGSSLAIFLGVSFLFIPIFSIIFSITTLLLVVIMTIVLSRNFPIRVLIISGLMVGAFFNALIYILTLIKPERMNRMLAYYFGGFANAEMNELVYITMVSLPIIIVIYSLVTPIKLMQLGEAKSKSLGLNVQWITFIVLLLTSIMTAIAVAFIGVIGFIGIIVPQLIRRYYFQYSLAIQMTLNIMIGALTMLFADVIGKMVINPVQIPASIILSLVGIPILFYILVTQSNTTR